MGWASDALWRDLSRVGIVPNVPKARPEIYEEEYDMGELREVPNLGDLVKVCDDRHILAHTEKAIMVRVGQTLYGDIITTFYPKSLCQIRSKPNGGYDVFVPKWVNRNRNCQVGNFDRRIAPGFDPLPF